MATPLNQADIAGIADAILGRLIDMSVGMTPTSPESANIQNGIDAGEVETVSVESVLNKFSDMIDGISQLVAAKIAQITIGSKQPAADGSPRVVVVAGNAPSSPNAGTSPTTPPVTDLRANSALEAAFAAPSPPPPPLPADIRANSLLDTAFGITPPTPASIQPTPQPKIFATAEAQRENAASKTSQAMAGIGSSEKGDVTSKFDELITAIRESVNGKRENKEDKEKPKADTKAPKESEGMRALGDIAKTVLKALIPISIAAAVLGSATSGMSTFLSAFKVLGAVIGTVLLPAFIVGGAVFLTLADIISESLIPNLEKWYEIILTGSLQFVNWLQKAAIDFANEILKLIPKMQAAGASMLEMAAKFLLGAVPIIAKLDGLELAATGVNPKRADDTVIIARAFEAAAKTITDELKDKKTETLPFKDIFERLNIPLVDGVPQIPKFGDKEGVAGRLPGNIQKMIAQFKFDNAPQAQSMSLVDAARNAQMAALNMSPFEQQMLDLVTKVIDALETVGTKIKPPVGQ